MQELGDSRQVLELLLNLSFLFHGPGIGFKLSKGFISLLHPLVPALGDKAWLGMGTGKNTRDVIGIFWGKEQPGWEGYSHPELSEATKESNFGEGS